MQKGLTAVELLIVVSVVAILGAIGFSVAAPARESARQKACISNLRHIYGALSLYGIDHDDAIRVPSSEVPVPGLGCTTPLLPYVSSQQLYYCPSAPPAVRKLMPSTYEWGVCSFDPQLLEDKIFAEMIITERARLGEQFPLVTCYVHDLISIAPKERDLYPTYQKTLVFELRIDGSVWHGLKSQPHPAPLW